jgi:hypothetical protein
MSVRRASTSRPQELAALVLHFHGAIEEHGVTIDRDLFLQAHADGRPGRGDGLGFVVRQALQHGLPRGLHRVHTQVQGRGVLHAARQREDGGVVHRAPQLLDDPVGQVGAHLEGLRIDILGLERNEPCLLVALEDLVELADADALQFHEGGERHFARTRVRRYRLEEAPAAQDRVDGFGDQRAVARAKCLAVAEEMLEHGVRRAVGTEHRRERLDGRFEGAACEVQVVLIAK